MKDTRLCCIKFYEDNMKMKILDKEIILVLLSSIIIRFIVLFYISVSFLLKC